VLILPASASAIAQRPGEPVVLTGDKLPRLLGADPDRIVAYAYKGEKGWAPLPIQIDERKLIDFGSVPANNATPGVPGTVYGTAPIGVTALQYADPKTFVGADDDPALDANDEVVLGYNRSISALKPKPGVDPPKGTHASTATRVKVTDPLTGSVVAIYVFEGGRKASRSSKDYVDYDFSLDSGDYKTTYHRADGPNPEHSAIRTRFYTAGFSDRWYFDRLELGSRYAKHPIDILDGFKFQFGPETCTRSEATFNDAEGAFVANIDGPLRAIRSYVGANSGPYTERTHYFYGRRHVIQTDLRVHAVPGPMIYHDLSAETAGMRYLDSSNLTLVAVDGQPDQLATTTPSWRGWVPPDGSDDLTSVWSADRVEGTFASGLLASASDWYLDDATPEPNQQCWGDSAAYGQAGFRSTYSMPNTDPSIGGMDSLRATTTDIMSPAVPGIGQIAPTFGELWAKQLDAPLRARAYPQRLSSG
jgi:hypothetical protein